MVIAYEVEPPGDRAEMLCLLRRMLSGLQQSVLTFLIIDST